MAPGHKPLMRSLGEFFGHIVRAVKTDPSPRVAPGGSAAIRSETTEETRNTPAGPVTLRRTTIEEITLPSPPNPRAP